MKNKGFLVAALISVVVVIVIVTILLTSKLGGDAYFKINPAFKPYIKGFTSGIVSTNSKIVVKLNFDFAEEEMIGKATDLELFDFKPNIKGETFWIDKQTIEFRPAEKLPHDKTYKINFNLNKLVDVPDSLRTFKFHIITMKQAMSVNVLNVKPYDTPKGERYKYVKIIGTVNTADFAVPENIEKTLSNNKNYKFKWTHNEGSKIHQFEIDSIERQPSAQQLNISWNGKHISASEKGDMSVEIPAFSEFKFVKATAYQYPDQHIVVQFTDPIDNTQNIEGLLQMPFRHTTVIEDNEITVYPTAVQKDEIDFIVHKSIVNSHGYALTTNTAAKVKFEEIKPNVRLTGKGVIVPSSNGLTFPFEAVNLSAVNVKIIKIFEDNMLQFLQVNEIDGNREIKRVGRQVFNKTIELTGEGIVDFSVWNSFALNLDELVKTEPGAIYQVKISFNKEHSLYPCNENTNEKALTNFNNASHENPADDYFEYSYYDYYYDYDYYNDYEYDYYEYNWYDRENPCKSSYYSNKGVSRNFLSSNLGIIAKRGNNDALHVFVSDLITTEPLSKVKIEVYNQQNQLIASDYTDNQGMLVIKTNKVPAFIIAQYDKQKGYLKLNPNNALSLSVFEVSGNNTDSDIKGFLYGERGVWRPGDSLYLSFILEDRNKKLPSSHPVAFTLTNPMGQITYKTTKTNGLNGFYSFNCKTPENAPTGNWVASVDVGGVRFTKNLKIETIMPNRLKINVDFGGYKLYAFQENNIILKSNWLHGAPANKLKADVNVTFSKMKTEFSNYKEYIFDDNSRYFSTEEYEVFNDKLNENGEASFSPNFNIDNAAPGVLKAHFQIRVFENSGAFSIDHVNIPYYPYKSYTGIKVPKGKGYSSMLHTGKTHNINIVNVDTKGNTINNGKVTAELYKLDWNWWYDYSGEGSSYINSYYMTPVITEEIDLPSGKGDFKIKVEYPDWGRYYIRITDNESGHSSGDYIYIDYPEWEGRNRMKETSAATLLTLTSDKTTYNKGEKIEITFPSAKNGRALISIEKGANILKTYWVKTQEGHTTFSFEATKEMTPNIFAHVTFIQQHAQTFNDLPIRLYGVIPLNIEDKNTLLKPIISMPDELKPEQKANISVSEESKKAMTYTLAIVDEGLLDLTRFKTPNPWQYFYAKEALSVRTWDIYDYVMGAYAGTLPKLLNIGGDGDLDMKSEGAKANRFKPMVRYIGPFYLEKGKTNKHVVDIPNYVGSVRVMVVAGQDAAYGNAQKTVAVRNELMILGTLPRVLGPNETVQLPVSVFAMDKKVKNVSIVVKTNNLFTIVGEKTKTLSFSETGDKLVNFTLKTVATTGVGTVKIEATSGNFKSVFDIEIDVRNPNPKVTDVFDFVIEPGKTVKKKFNTTGIDGSNKGIVEISSVPPINLEKRLNYLIAYPHGCLEQTTSGAFPQLFLDNLVELTDIQKKTIQANINAAVKKIGSMQLSNGGLTYWQGSSYADDWSTNYAGHFMLEAQAKGYNLPANFTSNFIKYQKSMANKWVPNTVYFNSDLVQAYRLYTLALAKAPELGAMNRLKGQKDLSVAAKWRLAAAYQMAGYNSTALKIIDNLSTQVVPYKELYYTYGSTTRDYAMILETLTLLNQKTKAANIAKNISTSLSSNEWMSTQTTAYSLMALSKYYKNTGAEKEMSYTYKTKNINGDYVGKTLVKQHDMLLKGKIADDIIEIKNNGKSTLFGRVILEGIPAPGNEKASENDVKLKVKYTDLKGNSISVDKLKQGEDFIAEITVHNPGLKGYYKELALTHIVPPGWEIHNTRMSDENSTLKMADYNYMDIRDDRINLYLNLRQNETKVYNFMFNASYIGKYYLPAIYIEAMYDATINAKVPGKWIEVVNQH